jgi:CheY-like chemotaxis protein
VIETMVIQTRAVAYPYFFGIRASRILVVCITAPVPVDLRIPSGRLAELQIEEMWNMTENTQRRRSRLVLADDHPDILEELRHLLEFEFDVLFTAADGHALIQAVDVLRPDGVISDVQMPGIGGIEAGRHILDHGWCNDVIVLTMHNEPHLVGKALAAGIRGYVLKVDANDELIPAIYAVLGGGKYLSRGVSKTSTH